MTAHAAEFFTLDEVNRLKIIQDVIDRRLTTQMAAQRLGMSDRQCRRLLTRYREDGPLGMASRRRGKASNHQLPQGWLLTRSILRPVVISKNMVNRLHCTATKPVYLGSTIKMQPAAIHSLAVRCTN